MQSLNENIDQLLTNMELMDKRKGMYDDGVCEGEYEHPDERNKMVWVGQRKRKQLRYLPIKERNKVERIDIKIKNKMTIISLIRTN